MKIQRLYQKRFFLPALSSGEAQAVATYPAGQVAGSRLPLTAQEDLALFPVGVTGSESFELRAFPPNAILEHSD